MDRYINADKLHNQGWVAVKAMFENGGEDGRGGEE